MDITVNTATLAGDIDKLKGALSSARAQLKEMFGQVTELDTMWDGPANVEFNRQFGIDYEGAKKMCETVESLLASMEYAKDRYNRCENEVHSVVAAIAL